MLLHVPACGRQDASAGAVGGAARAEADAAAERELERVLDKADFTRMEVIGQFNLGFILARWGGWKLWWGACGCGGSVYGCEHCLHALALTCTPTYNRLHTHACAHLHAHTATHTPACKHAHPHAGRLGRDVFIVDQHAADEKRNFERLTAALSLNKQPLLCPRALHLSPLDEMVVRWAGCSALGAVMLAVLRCGGSAMLQLV